MALLDFLRKLVPTPQQGLQNLSRIIPRPQASLQTLRSIIPTAQRQVPSILDILRQSQQTPFAQQFNERTNRLPFLATPQRIYSQVKSIPSILNKASEFIAPSRGFNRLETLKAKPTIMQSLQGLPKQGAEFLSFLGQPTGIGEKTLSRLSQTRLGGKMADIGDKITEYGKAHNPEEAKAMNIADILTLGLPIGKTKSISRAVETIAKTQDVFRIGKELKTIGIADDLIPKLSEKLKGVTTPQQVSSVLNTIKKGATEIAPKLPKTIIDELSTPNEYKGLKYLIKKEVKKTPLPKPIQDLVKKQEKQLINVERFNLPEKKKATIKKTAEEIRPELEQLKGERMSHNEVKKAAVDSEILRNTTTREQTLKRGATILRTRQHLAELAKGKGVSEDFVDTLKTLSQEGTNLARQLEQLKIGADPNLYTSKEVLIKKLLKLGVKTEDIVKKAENVDFTNMKDVTKFYRTFVKPEFGEMLNEYRYINLLSSPKTHIVNAFSNLLQGSFLNPATKLATGTIDAIGSTLTGKARQVYIREIPAYYKGAFNNIQSALQEAFKVMKGEATITRPDIPQIPTGSKLLKLFQPIPRFLEASDVFFRTIIKGGEKEALALKYTKQGKEIDDLVKSQIDKLAEKNASYYVFRKALDPRNKTGQGHLLSTIDKFTSVVYKLRDVPGVRWFVPFVQTPMNILKQGIEYSPLGLSTLPGAVNKTEQIGKTMVGSMVGLGAGMLALQGKTTWSVPTNEAEKEAFYASGRQPYSVKIGDNWYGYAKLGPLAYPIAMASAIQWYLKENPKASTETNEKKLMNVLSGVGGFFSDQSYMQGMNSLLQTLTGDPYAISQAVSNLPSQLIPLVSLQRWINQLIDPVYRKAESGFSLKSVLQNLEKGIVGLGRELPAYKTPTGEESKRDYPITNLFSPVGIGKSKPEMENLLQDVRKIQEMKAINKKESDVLKVEAEKTYNDFMTLPKDEANQMINDVYKNNPELYKKFEDIYDEKELGLTQTDKLIKSLGVENGERAKYIYEKQASMPKDEANKYLQDLWDKKLISVNVNKQLNQLMK